MRDVGRGGNREGRSSSAAATPLGVVVLATAAPTEVAAAPSTAFIDVGATTCSAEAFRAGRTGVTAGAARTTGATLILCAAPTTAATAATAGTVAARTCDETAARAARSACHRSASWAGPATAATTGDDDPVSEFGAALSHIRGTATTAAVTCARTIAA